MTEIQLSDHTSQAFNVELEEIRSKVLEMGGLVERQLYSATQALSRRDSEAAESAVVRDYQVNAMEVAIDEQCTLILARRQPAASDLRLVMAVIKAITDLERIGDEAERIARFTISLAGQPRHPNSCMDLDHLADHVREMLQNALDSFARMDVETALALGHEDKGVDREYEGVMRQTLTYMMEDPHSIPACLDVMWCARALERIADRCCNIGEYVIYYVKGKDVRHTSLDEMEIEAKSV